MRKRSQALLKLPPPQHPHCGGYGSQASSSIAYCHNKIQAEAPASFSSWKPISHATFWSFENDSDGRFSRWIRKNSDFGRFSCEQFILKHFMKTSNTLSLHSSELQWLWFASQSVLSNRVQPFTICSKVLLFHPKKGLWGQLPSWVKKVDKKKESRTKKRVGRQQQVKSTNRRSLSCLSTHQHADSFKGAIYHVFSLCSIVAGLTEEFHFLTTMWEKCQLLSTMLWLISLNPKPSLPLKIALILGCECSPTNKRNRAILWILSSSGL